MKPLYKLRFIGQGLLLCIFTAVAVIPASAQDVSISESAKYPGAFEIRTDQGEAVTPLESLFHPKSLINTHFRDPADEIWPRTGWPSSEVNFRPFGTPLPAGDLNGDGTKDLYSVFNVTADQRTGDLSDLTPKTLIYFSPSPPSEPDHIIYESLIAVGDFNGSGNQNLMTRSSEPNYTLYEFNGDEFITASGPTGLSVNSFSWNDFYDLDGDGSTDLLRTASLNLEVLFGAGQERDYELETYNLLTILANEGIQQNITDYTLKNYFSYNDRTFIVVRGLVREGEDAGRYAMIFEMDNDRSLSLHQFFKISDITSLALGSLFAAIHAGDEAYSLIFSHAFEHNETESDDPDFGTYRFKPAEENGVLFDTERTQYYATRAWPAGKLRGDGRTSFLVDIFGDNSITYHFAESEPGADQLVVGNLLPGQEENAFISLNLNMKTTFGDLSGNGLDDFIYIFSENTATENSLFGTYLIEGVAEGSYPATAYSLQNGDYSVRLAQEIFGLGDVTGNGADDFAVFYREGIHTTLALHQGGSNWKTPLKTWELEENTFIRDVVPGRFVNSTRTDLAILYRYQNDSGVFVSDIRFYEGGGSFPDDPYLRIEEDDFWPGLGAATFSTANISTIAVAGDVNGSGFDDLLVGASAARVNNEPVPAGLYFGGPSLSAGEPDVRFSPVGTSSWIGSTLTGLGDLNGDGFADFAVVNADEIIAEEGNQFRGRIHIYRGGASAEDPGFFDTPSRTLKADSISVSSGYNMGLLGFSEVTTGDFSGNGSKEIVAESFFHSFNNQGVPGVHIFESRRTTSQPSQMLGLRNDDFSGPFQDSELINAMGRNLYAGIPDLSGDGHEKLLVVGSSSLTNAALYRSGTRFEQTPAVIYRAPNQSTTMGAPGNFINVQYNSVIGDFNGDGTLNFLTIQPGDRNYRDTPIYLFEIEATGSVPAGSRTVLKTESTTSAGGTISEPRTRSSVTIPEGAVSEDQEIEVGTFNSVPPGANVGGVVLYLGPSGLTFNEPVTITIEYDTEDIPDGIEEEDLKLLRYDESDDEWFELETTVDTDLKTLTAETLTFSGFAAGTIGEITSADREESDLPVRFDLAQNYPNPFNPTTTIRYDLPVSSDVKLEVYDIIGRRVAVLVNDQVQAGRYTVQFDASGFASGVYFYRLQAGSFVQTRKLTVIK